MLAGVCCCCRLTCDWIDKGGRNCESGDRASWFAINYFGVSNVKYSWSWVRLSPDNHSIAGNWQSLEIPLSNRSSLMTWEVLLVRELLEKILVIGLRESWTVEWRCVQAGRYWNYQRWRLAEHNLSGRLLHRQLGVVPILVELLHLQLAVMCENC